jgi:hypothetical protein
MSRPSPKQPQRKSSKTNNPQQKTKKKNPKRSSEKSNGSSGDDSTDLELGQKRPSTNKNKKNKQQEKQQEQQQPSPKKKFQPGKVMTIRDEQKPKLNGQRVRLIQRPEGTKTKWEVEMLVTGRRLTVPSSKLV